MFRSLVRKESFTDEGEFITKQTKTFTKTYPNMYTTQSDISQLQSTKLGLGVLDPNTRQMIHSENELNKLYTSVNASDELTQQQQQCVSSDIDTLISSQNLESKVRCGWIYTKGTVGNHPQVSQGVLGTRRGPVASFENPKGTYYWNLDAAKKQIMKDRCGALVNCTNVGTDEYKGCAFSKTRGIGIPVDSNGRVLYPMDASLSAPAGSLVTKSTSCPPPPPPNSPQYAFQQSRDNCIPLPNGQLSRDCMLQQVTAAGCKQDGALYQHLLTSAQPTNYAAGLQNITSYKKYQQLATTPLLDAVVRDGKTSKDVVINNFKELNKQSSTVNQTGLNFAARDLCVKQGIMESYDFCNELTNGSTPPFNLECLQKAFRKAGGQPTGSMYPTAGNKSSYDVLGSWGAVKEYISKLAATVSATADSFIDAGTQRKALNQFLGITRDPFDNSIVAGHLGQPGQFTDAGASMQRFRLWINKELAPGKPAQFLQDAYNKFSSGVKLNITVTRIRDNNIRTLPLNNFSDGGYYWEIISTVPEAYQYGQYYAQDDVLYLTFDVIPPPYTDLGCWGDNWDRALNSPSMRGNTVDSCYNIAKKQNMKYFSVQDGDECYVGNSGYDKYGKIEGNCPPTGGAWNAHVYKIN